MFGTKLLAGRRTRAVPANRAVAGEDCAPERTPYFVIANKRGGLGPGTEFAPRRTPGGMLHDRHYAVRELDMRAGHERPKKRAAGRKENLGRTGCG